MIDVAAEREYQSQTREYSKAYTKWRNDGKNKFGYRFIHDSREHIYVDGGGFADKIAETSEKEALYRCLQFLGGIMFIRIIFEILQYLFLHEVFGSVYYGWSYYSMRNNLEIVSSTQAYIYCALKIITVLIILAITVFTLKLPIKVALPKEKIRPGLVSYGVFAAVLFQIMSRFFDYMISVTFSRLNIDTSFYYFMHTDTAASQNVYYLTELLVFPILAEILMRGYVLQLLRQFGDRFAIVISALAAACCYHDLTKIMYMFILSLLLGVITVKNGSLVPTILVRLVVVNLAFVLCQLSEEADNLQQRLIEVIICILLIAISLISITYLRSRIKNPFHMKADCTELKFSQKCKLLLNSSTIVVCLVVTLLATILSVRFI